MHTLAVVSHPYGPHFSRPLARDAINQYALLLQRQAVYNRALRTRLHFRISSNGFGSTAYYSANNTLDTFDKWYLLSAR